MLGIGFHELKWLQYVSSQGGLGDVLTFGRQGISIPTRQLDRLIGPVNAKCGDFAEDLLVQTFNATSVSSIDNSFYEGATHIGDLNGNIDIGRTFDTVIDFGTSEHVFDVAAAFRNAVRLCRVGGRIVHALPANGECGHGLYQFSPELFFSLYHERNGFGETQVYVAELMNERSWYRVAPAAPGRRIMANALTAAYVLCVTSKLRDVESLAIQQLDYQHAWDVGSLTPNGGRPWAERARALLVGSPVGSLAGALYRRMLGKTGLTAFNDDLHKTRIESLVP